MLVGIFCLPSVGWYLLGGGSGPVPRLYSTEAEPRYRPGLLTLLWSHPILPRAGSSWPELAPPALPSAPHPSVYRSSAPDLLLLVCSFVSSSVDFCNRPPHSTLEPPCPEPASPGHPSSHLLDMLCCSSVRTPLAPALLFICFLLCRFLQLAWQPHSTPGHPSSYLLVPLRCS